MEDLKGKFIDIYKNHIGREGADKLLEWLEKSDFFTAPASTKYHLAKQGGLLQHSLNVRDRLEYLCHEETKFNKEFTMPSFESIAICGLLHDLCKVNLYKTRCGTGRTSRGDGNSIRAISMMINSRMGTGKRACTSLLGS